MAHVPTRAGRGHGLSAATDQRLCQTLHRAKSACHDGVARHECDELLEQFRITHIRRSKAGKLSGGEKRRLEIARCLVSNPEIIMLDEPFAGIDPVTVQSIHGIIGDLRDRGISILITDHAAREILQITDRTYVISEGQVLCSGTAEEIVRHDEVKEKYLGDIVSFDQSAAPAPHFSLTQQGGTTSAGSGLRRRRSDLDLS